MGYVAGEKILDDEYNTFVNSSSSPYGYNHFAGTGLGEYGLGETSIATVSAGGTIIASQWNSLFTGLTNIANHTNVDTGGGAGVLASVAAVSAGDAIAIKSALITDLASLAAAVAGGSTGATALTTSASLQTITTAAEGWDNTATHEHSITWASADRMRHFFNAGGKVRIVTSTTQGTTNPKDQAFIDLGTALGNIDIGAQSTTRSGSGEGLTENGLANGFHDLGTGYTTLITLTSDNANYTSNTVSIAAKLDAVVGTAVTLIVKMVATDPADDTQYTEGNNDGPSGGDADINDTPRMVTNIYAITPNTSEGLTTSPTHNTVGNEGNADGTTT
jgi:hypothetical protein